MGRDYRIRYTMKLLVDSILLLVFAPSSTALPLTRRGAPFPSLLGLTTLTHDFSRPKSVSSPSKFFHESTFSYHYDERFASEPLPPATRAVHLRLMLRAYTTTIARIGIRTWLMHGGLLGWWWGSKTMPWDTNLDYMVDEIGMGTLGAWWNMSVHEFDWGRGDFGVHLSNTEVDGHEEEEKFGGTIESIRRKEWSALGMQGSMKKKYLLEVDPSYTHSSTKGHMGKIDARWTVTSTGLFIDITTLHIPPYSTLPPQVRESEHPSSSTSQPQPLSDIDEFGPDISLYTKDSYAYTSPQLFPLRLTTFEDTLTLVPYGYMGVLLHENGPDAITQSWLRGGKFEKERGRCVEDERYGEGWDKVEKGD